MLMIFERNLVHRCTLVKPGVEVGKDPYGRPIYEDVEIANVACRADQIRRRVSSDESGVDYILENMLFFSAQTELTESMKIKQIQDDTRHPVLSGTFGIQNIRPIYGRIRLHHYEVILQGSDA
jgi:hypothetical protein